MAKKWDELQEYEFMENLFEDLPPQPDDLKEWVNDNPLRYSRYLFTWTEKGKRYGYCTHCKTTSQIYQLGKIYDERDRQNAQNRHNSTGFCPHCKSTVIFKDRGRGRSRLYDTGYFLIAQPLSDGGVLVSSFYVMRDYSRDYENVETQYSEHYRVYFNTGISRAYKRTANREHYYGVFDKEDYYSGSGDEYGCIVWQPMKSIPNPQFNTSMYSMRNPPNYYYGFDDKTFRDSNLKYSCIEKFLDDSSDKWNPNVCRYLGLYAKNPALIERMMKQGFEKIVYERVGKSFNTQGLINWRAKSVDKALKIPKNIVNKLRGSDTKNVLTERFFFLHNIKDENVKKRLSQEVKSKYFIEMNIGRLEYCLKYNTPHKLAKYISEISFSDYADYLQQCEKLKLDMTKDYIIRPQDFEKAHRENTQLLAEIKHQKELKEAAARDEAFKEQYKKLFKKYAWQTDKFLIRPAKGKGELMIEGKTLNHCVYTNYSDRYINGKTIILVIREKESPDVPFYTMEISSTGAIIQCRGQRNCAPTDEVKAFTEEWKLEVEQRKKQKHKNKTAVPAA